MLRVQPDWDLSLREEEKEKEFWVEYYPVADAQQNPAQAVATYDNLNKVIAMKKKGTFPWNFKVMYHYTYFSFQFRLM